MRPPSFPALLSTLHALTNTTSKVISSRGAGLARQPSTNRVLRTSMPTLPFLGSLSFFSSAKPGMATSYPDNRSEQEWQAVLNKEQFRILRQKGTEPGFTGEYDKHYPDAGVYTCAACNTPLYKANHKFKSGCGWPAYFDSIPGAVTRHTDSSYGMERTEIVCSNCGGHLGHVFKGEGFPTPTDERHCVNSISLKFSKDDPQTTTTTTTAEAGKGEAK